MAKIKYDYTGADIDIPDSKKVTGKICFIGELTLTNCDLDHRIHEGFTIGKGKRMYWMMLWHGSGNVTVFSKDGKGDTVLPRRWLSGDTEITVHFK